MFRRRRSKSIPPSLSAPSPAATSAAAQAFLSHRSSNASLSSAAAAAALRAHAGSPTEVGNVQTRRMVQRHASTSSRGSHTGGSRQTNSLQRRSSSSSMTERTFRESPSPRPDSPIAAGPDAPPVPALPKNLNSLSDKAHRRASSAEPTKRVTSPTSPKGSTRGASVDRAGASVAGRGGNRVMSLSSVNELDRSDSRNSVNFSYPKKSWRSPPASPVPGQRVSSPIGSEDRNVSPVAAIKKPGVLKPAEISRIQNTVQDASFKPTNKKKQSHLKGATEGSYLAKGTSGGKPTGTYVDRIEDGIDEPLREGISDDSHLSKEKSVDRGTSDLGATQSDTAENGSLEGQDSYASNTHRQNGQQEAPPEGRGPESRTYNTRAAGLLTKQPSIVREDRELEEAADDRPADSKPILAPLPQKPSRVIEQFNKANPSKSHITPKRGSRPASQPPPEHSTLAVEDNRLKVADGANGSVRASRNQSLSPVRSAHFSPVPTYATPDGPKHQPLPRSVSPAKSAMKHSPSPRAESPACLLGAGRGYTPSETSEAPSLASEESSQRGARKKKNVRVSFEDDSTVIGPAPSPPASSPDSPVAPSLQNRDTPTRGWLGLGRKKQDEKVDANRDDELNDLLPPRPALPSFGSVRGRKERDDGSEPLEKTVEADQASSIFTSSTGDRIEIPTDQVIGGVLSQDSASKKSPSAEAPLSPIGEESHLAAGVDGSNASQSKRSTIKVEPQRRDESHATSQAFVNGSKVEDGRQLTIDDVPAIAVVPATPAFEETESWLGMPGTFPVSTDSLKEERQQARELRNYSQKPNSKAQVTPSIAKRPDASNEEDSDDNSSIYSDAAEDLSDLEGDGFGSINAIVESPTLQTGLAITTPPDSPSIQLGKEDAWKSLEQPHEPAVDEGWDKARAYWSSLSDQRKQEIEAEAVVQGGRPESSSGVRTGKGAGLTSKQDISGRPTNGVHGKSDEILGPSKTKGTANKSTRIPPKSALRKQSGPEPTGATALTSSLGPDAIHRTRPSSQPRAAAKQPQSRQINKQPEDSDSDASASSFRKRRRSASESGRVSMRRTMRGSSEAGLDRRPLSMSGPGPASGRLSLRSASPSSLRPMSPSIANRSMRTSMRSPTDKTPSLRNKQKERPLSPNRFPGFGKSKNKKSSRPSGSRFSSRFAESSDEEDVGISSRFRSRFDDSSDEEVPTQLAPVRGIPRKHGQEDGDSTDLSDSSVEEVRSPQTAAKEPVKDSKEGKVLGSGSLRAGPTSNGVKSPTGPPKEQNRRSFFGSLGRKKDSSKGVQDITELGAARDTFNGVGQHDREATNGIGAPSSPRSPKLRRRTTPSYVKTHAPEAKPTDRPKTSDGAVGGAARPDLGTRRATDEQAGPLEYDSALGRSGKKKKFPKLRKVFGLS